MEKTTNGRTEHGSPQSAQTLSGCAPLAGALSPAQRELLGQGVEMELAPGEDLDPRVVRECLGFVLHGQLDQSWKIDGESTAVTVLRTGDWFGQSAVLFGRTPESVALRATAFTRVLTLNADQIRQLLETDRSGLGHRVQREAMGYLARRAVELIERLHQRQHASTDTLVLDALHEAASWPSAMSHPEGTLVTIQRQRLAERVGCTRMTIARVLQRLSESGQVRLLGRRILLVGQGGRGMSAA